MTTLANKATRFRLDLMPETEEDIQYSFRFGRCDNFKRALEFVKRIPLAQRDYDPEDEHRWTVKASPVNLAILCEAFDNFRELYNTAKNQPRLPGM